jgi:GST-like protein
MIDLYAAGTSNGLRARMALEECSLPYKLNAIALDKGEHKTPRFLALNPNGEIPVIVDQRARAESRSRCRSRPPSSSTARRSRAG